MPNKKYSDSEIREIMESIKYDYRALMKTLPEAGKASLFHLQVGHTLDSLKIHLERFKAYFMASHDFTRANVVFGAASQIWANYWKGLEQEEYDIHDDALELRDCINDLGDCIKKGEQWCTEAFERGQANDAQKQPETVREQESQNTIEQLASSKPNGKMTSKKRETPTRFTTNMKEGTARKIYTSIAAQGYISNDTQPSEWLWICGIDTDIEPSKKQVDWLKGQNELVYFVYRMFREENENDLWAIASRVFTIKGKAQKSSSLRTANSKNNISPEKIAKLDKILRIW